VKHWPPIRWPRRLPGVEADVLRQFGRPILLGSRLPVECVAGRVKAGDSKRHVADDYCIGIREVERAVAAMASPWWRHFRRAARQRFVAYAGSPDAWWKALPAEAFEP